uniref:Putative acetyltransferase n=1 Tax=uncultured Verrucomicrobiota bacterium TaxID=156588 RepID=D2DXS0_9BACT|nr:putative acetyltransferase [uncultured Verrucomicrobiota bacterium]
MNAPHIRLATEADLAAINAIYNHYVEHSTCTYQLAPESEAARLAWFYRHGAAHPVTVAEAAGEVLGWASLNVFNPREAYARTVENSVYIHHEHHRRGLGRAMLADLIARARALDHHTIIAGISAEQTASIRLHLGFGFEEIGRLRQVGFKHGQWLDVVSMQLML